MTNTPRLTVVRDLKDTSGAEGSPMSPGELQALFLRGAEAGARTLVSILERGAQDGTIKPRDLAVVTGIMVDKVAKLAPFVRREEEPLTLEDLARAEEDAERLLAERQRERSRSM